MDCGEGITRQSSTVRAVQQSQLDQKKNHLKRELIHERFRKKKKQSYFWTCGLRFWCIAADGRWLHCLLVRMLASFSEEEDGEKNDPLPNVFGGGKEAGRRLSGKGLMCPLLFLPLLLSSSASPSVFLPCLLLLLLSLSLSFCEDRRRKEQEKLFRRLK